MSGAPTTPIPSESPAGVELLTAGSRFARYDVVRCIGVGGMGAVFEATHTLLRKRVAIKTLHTSHARSEAAEARFLREAETVARIRHPNVVDISDVGIERGIPFLVMEFLEGEDLSALLAREGALAPRRAVDLLLPAIAGLCAVHRLGIVHRDIKPENLFLALDALGGTVPKLVDFGVSKDVEAGLGEGLPLRHTVAGTPYYMAPEQARGSAVLDGRADQYALGVVLYQCLTGVRPFESESLLELIHRIDAGDYQPLSQRAPELPSALAAVIARAMARRVEERFPSTEAFGQALLPFASDEVAASCAREFAVERRSALPQRDSATAQRLSAPTVPVGGEGFALPQTSPASTASGVRARDTAAPETASAVQARSRRAFVVSALITLVLLVGVAAVFYASRGAPPSPTTERAAPPSAPSARPPAVLPAAPLPPTTAPVPAAVEAPAPAPSENREAAPVAPARPRREPKPEPPRPQVDIQLSR